ncbi:chromosome segregation protein SMC [Peptoniphilus sp. MSJ-1]|uniref:Chromosome partition protein Smc n=1 Tax=Peptoniphilus ovalis TaxID=2841503 RepID=A0ABS6FIF5_9FIRM|nr:chromosome segregation protein SMC [Peptoniphilus ovalis]MBU5669000.1 chromosome segregation protein SMC [Peptoniphilus ovalis]
MLLKSVTMQGFKSFANRTKIELDESITAIVGPNGSGKSNITDAITWVLGETSVKNLRGSKMEDVIFSGTDSKKPLGMAEVTIVFDNSDKSLNLPYNEVSVTRRMYRSLESEFLINNKKCRLKDIKELFMDTGIGKDGYSIIGQGKIETILSSKPEDRRSIFEEAAGISKFKYKKLESNNKLLKTEENLIRIEDILSEIEVQEENLRVQAEKAENYLKDFEILKKYDINYSYKDIKKQEEEINALKEKLSNLDTDSTNFEEERDSLLNKINNYQDEISKLQKEINKSKEDYELNKSNYEDLNLRITINEEKINSIKNEISSMKYTNEELKLEIEKDNDELLNIKSSAEDLDEKSKKFSEILYSKNSEINELENEINYLREIGNTRFEKSNSIKNEIENIKFKNETLKDIISDKKSRKEILEKNIDNFTKNELEFSDLIEKAKSNLESIKNNLKSFEEEISEKIKNIENYKDEHEKLIQNNSKLNQDFSEIDSRLKILKNMESNFEGYNRTVKSFMNFTSKNNYFKDSLFGPVGEKFIVNKKYERAISVALGSMSQNIIVSTTSDTKEMLNLLENYKMGRATFLPIDRIKGNKVNISFSENGIVGVACDLIKFDKIFENIFHNLLGRVLIVDNFNNASRISKKYNLKVVTLKGEVFNPSGAITGGSINNYNSSFIQRKNDIKLLNDNKKELTIKINNLEAEINLINDKINSLSDEISNINLERENLKEKYNNVESNILKNIQNQELNKEYLNKYITEKEELEKSIGLDYENYKNNLKVLDDKNNELEEIISQSDSSEKLEKTSNILEKLKSEKLDIQLQERENKEKQNYLNREIERLDSSVFNSNQKLENNFNNLESLEKNLKEKIDFKENSKDSINRYRENMEIFKVRESELQENYNISNEDLKEYNEKYINLKENILISNNEKEKILLKIEMKENSISSLSERIKEDYNIINIEDYLDEELVDLKESSLKKYRKIIKNYGEVNISSIEEHKVVSERLIFYKKQRDDLTNSKEEIKSIINKLDTEMKKVFKEAIEEISENFEEIFKILFNGGRAEISMDGDILSSGIEIKASPPGKRLQSLSLLSGGERSLTAVALLFSFLKYRPASFCILDEIDAALDDANIKRYADYLLTLNDIQFIIITHRKLTMEIAKSMYGVTMEEKGVSKLYSVKLED